MGLDAIKEKLRKLIAKEESARELGNLAEAEAFAAGIQRLLLEYQLELSDLKTDRPEEISRELVELKDLLGRNEASWIYDLYRVGAENNFCMVIYPYRMSDPYLFLIGEPTSREFVHYFVHQLVSKLRALARKSWSEYEGPEKRNTFIRGFLAGAVVGIRQRLFTEREKVIRNTPQANALVLTKDLKVKQWVSQNMTVKKAKPSKTSSQDGWGKGFEAGNSVTINKGVKGTNPKLLN